MKEKKKFGKRKTAWVVLIVLLSVVLLAALAAAIYVGWFFGKIHKDPNTEETLSPEQLQQILDEDKVATRPADVDLVEPEDVQWTQYEAIETPDHIFNIMLVGQDRRPGEIRARSDTMMLITINTKDNTITMTSFLRDIYVQIPGSQPNRLNLPYVYGGFLHLADTLEANFGIRVDRFVEVDFDGFKKVIDAVGGVDIELTEEEAAYMNKHRAGYVTAGVNHLNGNQALEHARNRTVGGSDFARTQRQQEVISAIFEKTRQLDLLQINDLMRALTDVVTTNLTVAELMSYVVRFYPKMQQMSAPESVRIPADGTYEYGWIDGIGSVVIVDFEANRKIVAATQK